MYSSIILKASPGYSIVQNKVNITNAENQK